MIPSQMLKGVLEGCILAIISRGETYGYEISQKISAYGFGSISEGTIYPMLLRLEKGGYIQPVLKESPAGPKRKYFHLTEDGTMKLHNFMDSWYEIDRAVDQVLGGKEK